MGNRAKNCREKNGKRNKQGMVKKSRAYRELQGEEAEDAGLGK